MSEKEKLLKATVDLRPGCIKQLTTKQGTEGIKELLKTGLWEGEGAALSIVHKLNEAAIIESSKWMLTGKAQEVNIKASNVWPGANENLIISFMCDNLEEFEMEDMCCVSKWRNIDEARHKWIMNGSEITKEQAVEAGGGDACIRIHLFIEGKDHAKAWFCIIPQSKEHLIEQIGRRYSNRESVPVYAYDMKNLDGSKIKVTLVPQEDDKGTFKIRTQECNTVHRIWTGLDGVGGRHGSRRKRDHQPESILGRDKESC